MNTHKEIISKCYSIIRSEGLIHDKMQMICNLLAEYFDNYDWVGFYLSDIKKRNLHLGPFYGESTEHKLIPYGRGVCGQVAEAKTTILINDITREKNYISCNINVKSEIVVPIIKNSVVIGQIDVDSYKLNAFNDKDQKLLEEICIELSNYL